MAVVYIGIILAFRVVQAIFNKKSSNEVTGIPVLVKFTSFKNLIAAILGVILLIVGMNGFKCNLLTVIIAGFSGITLFFSTFFSVYGMKTATVSVNSMFGTAGMLVPLLAGVFIFGNPISPMQWVGVLVFFVSAFLLIKNSQKTKMSFNFKTLLILIGSMLANGCTMLAQQLFTFYVPDGDVTVFSFISFGVITLFGGISVLIMDKKTKNKGETPEKLSKPLMICGVALAVAVFFINQLATICTALVSPVILFTFINGGGTIISTLVAAVMYKEKLTVRSILGVIIGIASLVIIKMF